MGCNLSAGGGKPRNCQLPKQTTLAQRMKKKKLTNQKRLSGHIISGRGGADGVLVQASPCYDHPHPFPASDPEPIRAGEKWQFWQLPHLSLIISIISHTKNAILFLPAATGQLNPARTKKKTRKKHDFCTNDFAVTHTVLASVSWR